LIVESQAKAIHNGYMKFFQQKIQLRPFRRGFHLISNEILNSLEALPHIDSGMMNIFIQHSSASISINENADPDVRLDMETIFNRIVPEKQQGLYHTLEGDDDMPAHVKSSIIGSSINIPWINGRPALGTWQGIYLCEHRNAGGGRKLVVSLWGI
jgi:secondary thiamine-phosphate synthase enzyme